MKFKGTQNYISTEDLNVAVNAAITLEKPLLIKGEPGTGKTEFIKDCINNYCVPNNVSFDVIAYTGKAASVLRSRISGKGSTIHKFLYEVDYVFDEETEQFKRKNKIKKIKLDILFIDESSMLSTGVTGFKVDGEKTFLLDELIKKLKNEEIKKIIFVVFEYASSIKDNKNINI